MSLKNFLDLRKKSPQQIKIVERIILQKRSIKYDIFLTLSVILVATGVIWGISKADPISDFFSTTQVPAKSFSIIGKVTEITDTTISIDSGIQKEEDKTSVGVEDNISKATTSESIQDSTSSSSTIDTVGSVSTTTLENSVERNLNPNLLPQEATSTNESEATTTSSIIDTMIEGASDVIENVVNVFTPTASAEQASSTSSTDIFNISKVSSVQTNHFKALSIYDIKVGDNIILQGIEKDGVITIFKIFSYGTEVATGILTEAPAITEDVATITVTNTEEVETTTGTTTNEIATTTASTAEELVASSTDSASSTPKTIIEVIKDVFGNVIDAITGSSSTSTDVTQPTTDQNATSSENTPITPESTNSSIVDTVIDTASNVVEKVVELLIENREEETNTEQVSAEMAPSVSDPTILETSTAPIDDINQLTN